MKDATGELSMTAIAVVAIAAIGLVFYQLIWPSIRENIRRSTYCSQAYNCKEISGSQLMECTYLDQSKSSNGADGSEKTIRCPNQNKVTG